MTEIADKICLWANRIPFVMYAILLAAAITMQLIVFRQIRQEYRKVELGRRIIMRIPKTIISEFPIEYTLTTC